VRRTVKPYELWPPLVLYAASCLTGGGVCSPGTDLPMVCNTSASAACRSAMATTTEEAQQNSGGRAAEQGDRGQHSSNKRSDHDTHTSRKHTRALRSVVLNSNPVSVSPCEGSGVPKIPCEAKRAEQGPQARRESRCVSIRV
jgi:hypothetical protein